MHFIQVPGIGLLLSPKLPSTNLKRNDEEESVSFHSEGLFITPLEPMKAWHIHYRGIMRLVTLLLFCICYYFVFIYSYKTRLLRWYAFLM